MRNPNPLNVADLKNLLTLTRISTFSNGYGNAEQDYFYVQSAYQNASREYKIKFLTVEESVIDNLQQSFQK